MLKLFALLMLSFLIIHDIILMIQQNYFWICLAEFLDIYTSAKSFFPCNCKYMKYLKKVSKFLH